MKPKSPMELAPLDFGRAQRAAFPFREGTTAATGEAVEPRSGVGSHDAQAQEIKKMSSDAKPTPDMYKAAPSALCTHRPLPKGDFGRAQRAKFPSGHVTQLNIVKLSRLLKYYLTISSPSLRAAMTAATPDLRSFLTSRTPIPPVTET